MDLKQKLIFPVLSLLMGTFLAFILGEVSLRLFNIGYSESPLNPDPTFHHIHPKNFRYVAYNETHEFGGFEVYFNQLGNIANPSATSKNTNHPCHVVFLGDSFTEARQVPYHKSFVGLLESSSPCKIDNYGISSYSPIFYLLQWRKLFQHQEPDLVVVQLYSNDIQADTDYAKVALRDSSGKIIAIPGPDNTWFKRQLRNSFLLRYIRKIQLQLIWLYENNSKTQKSVAGLVEENPEITEFSRDIIVELHKEITKTKSQFLLIVVPSKYHLINKNFENKPLRFDKKWEHIAQQYDIPYLDLSAAFDEHSSKKQPLFFKHDIHFNENGHQIVRDLIKQTYPIFFIKQ